MRRRITRRLRLKQIWSAVCAYVAYQIYIIVTILWNEFALLFEFHLNLQYHVFHILVNALEVGIQDAFPCVYGRELVELGQGMVGIVLLFRLNL